MQDAEVEPQQPEKQGEETPTRPGGSRHAPDQEPSGQPVLCEVPERKVDASSPHGRSSTGAFPLRVESRSAAESPRSSADALAM